MSILSDVDLFRGLQSRFARARLVRSLQTSSDHRLADMGVARHDIAVTARLAYPAPKRSSAPSVNSQMGFEPAQSEA